jgi:hypothetical protein
MRRSYISKKKKQNMPFDLSLFNPKPYVGAGLNQHFFVMLCSAFPHARSFVESGSYLGDTAALAAQYFDRVDTIELSQDLHRAAKERFATVSNVRVHQGDSGRVLRDILPEITRPKIFWLDGHYSEGITSRGEDNTPILR